MVQNISLTNDIAFRYIFGAKQNAGPLISLLNAILVPKGITPLREIKILNPFLNIDHIGEKRPVVDIHAVDECGRIYNIEMQVAKEEDYEKRGILYLSKLYGGQLDAGKGYGEAKPCIGIHILDFIYFEDRSNFHNEGKLIFTEEPYEVISDDLNIHFIELPKIDYSSKSFTFLKKWLYFIENANRKEDPMIEQIRKEVPEIDKAALAYESFIAEREAQAALISRLKSINDQASQRAKAIAEGLATGEAKKQRELALNLKAEGFEIAQIARLTGLSIEEVKRL